MKHYIKHLIFTILAFCFNVNVEAQNRLQNIELQLEKLALTTPGLNQEVQLSFSKVSIQEFIRALAEANKLNISVDPDLKIQIANNFSNVQAKNVLLFLCKEYDLEIELIGNIISIFKFNPPIYPKQYIPKKLDINYNKTDDLLSLNLKNDSLGLVVKEITRMSNKNVLTKNELASRLISGYIQNMSFSKCLENIALSNNLELISSEDEKTFVISSSDLQEMDPTGRNSYPKNHKNNIEKTGATYFKYNIDENQLITLYAVETPIIDIIKTIAKELNVNHFLFTSITDLTTANLSKVSFDYLLNYILNGTKYTYKKSDELYLIGDRNLENLRKTEVIQLQYRSVNEISEIIPESIKKEMIVSEFPELNSLVVSGSNPAILELKQFLKEIDRVVPVVLIEVLIVEVAKGSTLSTGIKARLGKNGEDEVPDKTTGSLFPDVDVTLSSKSINDLLESFDGFGILKLGRVTPDFYMSLMALEKNNYLKLNSTPKLAAMNGHEASLKIGETTYYYEETQNVYFSQGTQTNRVGTYKPVNADLSIKIKPIVSGDEQITLEIEVQNSDFTKEKIDEKAPPGQITRNFTSMMRIRNEEVVLLGGLENKSMSNAGTGVPFLSKIPVIKWFFSSREKISSNSKLNIFIKPTIVY